VESEEEVPENMSVLRIRAGVPLEDERHEDYRSSVEIQIGDRKWDCIVEQVERHARVEDELKLSGR
jgi:hypothetical protein